MAIKKSELYSSLWASCDELRGGMDASQYKDYVLVLLFIKYVSDKYAGQAFAPITIPKGAGFADMVALKGKKDIGDQINKRIIAPLANANTQLSQSDFPDFNDPTKLGSGKEMVDRLTNLVAIFESRALDFSKNRAEGDDILGDAYEYLMRHFATESGKSKGQFYTPAEVSRIMARVIGIGKAKTSAHTTVYDPTCGSGSLLLKVADEARTDVSIYGQEKDAATSGLARMNMILHDNPTAEIKQGNTIAKPLFEEGGSLKIFDYVVANPPFSDKRWSTGLDPEHDPHQRFESFGIPPAKQGDYNLNLPRYIDNREAEDVQDIEAHLNGGIPMADIDALREYWEVCPKLRKSLFRKNRSGYRDLGVEKAEIKPAIHGHPEFAAFVDGMNAHFAKWRKKAVATLRRMEPGCHPKEVIRDLSEGLLDHYTALPLLDQYAVYQHLMDYWAGTMQDDVYLIDADGWKAEPSRIIVKDKKGKEKDKGWTCDLVPKPLVVARYFADEQAEIDACMGDLESTSATIAELEEEHGGEDGAFAELEKINKAGVTHRLREIKESGTGVSPVDDGADEVAILKKWLQLTREETELKRAIKDAEAELDAAALAKYPELGEDDVKTLVVDDKWLATLESAIHGEMDRISQALTSRIKELADRYECPLPQMTDRVAKLEKKVGKHLERMGFAL